MRSIDRCLLQPLACRDVLQHLEQRDPRRIVEMAEGFGVVVVGEGRQRRRPGSAVAEEVDDGEDGQRDAEEERDSVFGHDELRRLVV